MKKLFDEWGEEVSFLDVFIRQAHPGPHARHYRSFDEKMRDAERYVRFENIEWPVAVDDIEGTVHQVYGGLADPSYLLDAEGRVTYYDLWTSAPVLHTAMTGIVRGEGSGIPRARTHRRPHLGPPITDGWRALRRGAPQSLVDLMKAAPGSPLVVWLGHLVRPVLAPLTMRARPLSRRTRWSIAFGTIAAIWAVRRLSG